MAGKKRRWGMAILSWAVLFFILVAVADLYTTIRYEEISSRVGHQIAPSFISAPWWAECIFLIACVFTGKKFLSIKNSEQKPSDGPNNDSESK